MTPYDMPAVRSIAREAERNNYRFSSLVLGVVKSVPFQMRSREAQARAERERDSAKPQEQGVASIREAQARQGVASIEEQPAPKQESIK
jgi:predicted GTPase